MTMSWIRKVDDEKPPIIRVMFINLATMILSAVHMT